MHKKCLRYYYCCYPGLCLLSSLIKNTLQEFQHFMKLIKADVKFKFLALLLVLLIILATICICYIYDCKLLYS